MRLKQGLAAGVRHNSHSHARAVLLDVGGTLWPDTLPVLPGADPCLEQLRQLLPEAIVDEALLRIRQGLARDDASLVQDTHALVVQAVHAVLRLAE